MILPALVLKMECRFKAHSKALDTVSLHKFGWSHLPPQRKITVFDFQLLVFCSGGLSDHYTPFCSFDVLGR